MQIYCQKQNQCDQGAGIWLQTCTDVKSPHRYSAFIHFLLTLMHSPLCTEEYFSFFPAAAVSHQHRPAVSIRSRSPSTPPGEPDESCSYWSSLFILHSCLPFLLVRESTHALCVCVWGGTPLISIPDNLTLRFRRHWRTCERTGKLLGSVSRLEADARRQRQPPLPRLQRK